ncbi:Inositol phosphorylceramide glucuronosyltransferase 1 [Camellia lanceoleosa]|uniref:Inositol phosphorylceramide glucuronosyltransferase 1 n=1 Tax=Camellia lanceoleosa TaxID=1840588 RepID=A0ACC0GC35_9ERIC|nr:Inositol phosphorylceramide glucuronosyltransferase 1 [Camellia lanceoleosa]
MERLSTLYNADVGLYMLANKKELRVIHYTLGPLKPWDWWTSWLLKPVDNAREHLEETLPGTGGGKNPKDEILVKLLFLLPLFTLLFYYYRSFLQWGKMKAYQVGSVSSHLESVDYDSGKGHRGGIFLRHCYMLLWVRNGILVRLDVCVISQLEDGHFYLEDLTGTVEINI